MQSNNKRKQPGSSQKKQPGPKRQRVNNGVRNPGYQLAQSSQPQIGAVVSTKLTRQGISDIRSLRVAWVAGTTYVGNGTNGTNNSVYFETASGTYLIRGWVAASSSGQFPVAMSDTDVGASYVADIMKHFARLRIKKLWLHVDSLQPSTSNNMMTVFAPSRGPGAVPFSYPVALATAAVTANTVPNVSSMKGAFTVDSWESKCVDITEYIAGGSGPRQDEFEIGNSKAAVGIYAAGGNTQSGVDGVGLVPCCIAVAGNSTTTTLPGTSVHQVSIEAEIDLLDFIGGMAQSGAEE